jgi:hypothetical protein
VLTASYVGYAPRRVALDGTATSDLALRLTPEPLPGQEVVVTGTLYQAGLDTTWHRLVRPDLYAPLGEASVLRALQPLPSVTLSPALSGGLTVRGSQDDGFQVLLDGASVYSQHHFFGFFDAFNADALQTVGFFYDVTPAEYQAPPGGTLAFTTRTGSQTDFRATVGASNVAARATVEGPLLDGRGSWLLSGRHSYLDAIDWLGNSDLVAQGLEVNRSTGPVPADLGTPTGRLVQSDTPSARFYDVHGKLYVESNGGRRMMLSAYAGGDRTEQPGERYVVAGDGLGGGRLEQRPVATTSRWGNETVSLQVQAPLGRRYSRTVLALSHYHSRYAKDDFTYARPDSLPAFTDTTLTRRDLGRLFLVGRYAYESDLLDVKLAQHLDGPLGRLGTWSLGGALHAYRLDYDETLPYRVLAYGTEQQTGQIDLFGQIDATPTPALEAHLGLRSHYFSGGSYLRLSPRLRLRAFPQRRVSVGLGASRAYQFLHRLTLQNTTSADVWVLTTDDQPPGSVDYLSGGLYLRPHPTMMLQVEGYWKTHRNLRQREISAPARLQADTLGTPWFFDNTAYARGLEVLHRQRLGAVQWTNSYTLSRVELQNDAVNGGHRYPAEWDRRHQFTTHLQADLGAGISVHAAWLYATGAPNVLAYEVPSEPDRLDPYHRLDASLHLRRRLGNAVLEARASVFNLYDRDNPWYRDVTGLFDTSRRLPRFAGFTVVDVYDLGLQPAFDLSVTF